MAVTTKFDPERIAQAADSMYKQYNSLNTALDTIVQRTDILKNYWQSAAADAYQERLKVFKKAGDEFTDTLLSLSERLQKISGIQRSAEKEAVTKTEELPIDGVN